MQPATIPSLSPQSKTPTTPATPSKVIEQSATFIVGPTQSVLSPTVVFKITDTEDRPPEKILIYQPLEILSNPPANANLPGTLVVMGRGGDPSYIINFVSDTTDQIPEDQFCSSTSPDGKWMAYCQRSTEPSVAEWLVIKDAYGQEVNRLPIEPDWFYGDVLR